MLNIQSIAVVVALFSSQVPATLSACIYWDESYCPADYPGGPNYKCATVSTCEGASATIRASDSGCGFSYTYKGCKAGYCKLPATQGYSSPNNAIACKCTSGCFDGTGCPAASQVADNCVDSVEPSYAPPPPTIYPPSPPSPPPPSSQYRVACSLEFYVWTKEGFFLGNKIPSLKQAIVVRLRL